MWGKVILILLIALAIVFSIKLRMISIKRKNSLDHLPDAPISSFLSESLAHLVGVAGGVYLSLTLIVTFLELDLPGKVSIGGITMQPLAMIALILAILQPIANVAILHLRNK